MKLAFRDIEPFVKKPDPSARVILVYGPDNGLMKERASQMGLTVVSDLADPFNVAHLTADLLADDPARLRDETQAISMMGGDRLIRIEDASDKLTILIKSYLEAPSTGALVILEAGELGPRSTLRALCEKSKHAAAVPCYVEDEKGVERLIRESLKNENTAIDPDALGWLAVNIAGDRRKIRQELEKLLTYKGPDTGRITLEDVQAACGETGALALEDLVYGVGGHHPMMALKTYALLLEEGTSFVVIVRALQNHFRRLHLVRAHMDSGESQDIALKRLNPPIFFKQEPAFKAQIQSWSLQSLNTVMGKLMDLEAQCKKTGAPVETLCAQAVLGLSRKR